MKTLAPVIVGTYTFRVGVEHAGGSQIKVTVTCDTMHLTGTLNHQGKHDHPESQFEKDVNDFALRLATELAGTLRSTELAKKFTEA